MKHEQPDRFDALRDAIVGHLEQVQSQLQTDIAAAIHGLEQRLRDEIGAVEQRLRDEIGAVEQRLTKRLDAVDVRLDTLRAETAERFESVDQRFRATELRMTLFENRHWAELAGIRTAMDTEVRGELELLKKQVTALNANVALVNGRLEPLELAVSSWAASTAGLGEDVKQRFRVVNERLAGIEQRLAA